MLGIRNSRIQTTRRRKRTLRRTKRLRKFGTLNPLKATLKLIEIKGNGYG